MKRTITFLILNLVVSLGLFAANYSITISGISYSPATLTVNVGDNITISASTMHPLVQVDNTTWMAGGSTPMTGGWGTKTSDYTFTASASGTIYFVCSQHVSLGMKGKIIVNTTAGINTIHTSLSGFNIYPNPVSKNANLTFNLSETKNISINVFNTSGKMINEKVISQTFQSGTNNISLDVSNLQDGIYYIAIKTDDYYNIKPIVIIN